MDSCMDSFSCAPKLSVETRTNMMDDGEIEGYNTTSTTTSTSNSSPSSGITGSSAGTKSCGRQQDDELDLMDDVERIISRQTISRRILALLEAPEFVQRMRSYDEAELGKSVMFTAQYRAVPKPTVKWFKDEEEVRPTDRHELDTSSESEGIIRLIIHDVVASDEGAYKCKVENCEGVASTTGYLSVAGKPSPRSRSSRTSGKLSTTECRVSGISTPPLLGPIAEQKSMEEREEMELSRQPPSPLQDFIDSIRRSAKSKHSPIFYGTADIFTAHDDIDDMAGEDDAFGNESYTPTGTPDNGLESGSDEAELSDDNLVQDSIYICATDNFKSPEFDLSPSYSNSSTFAPSILYATQTSKEDSAYDSDSREDERPAANRMSDVRDEESNVVTTVGKPVCRHTRLRHLQLKHRLAVDMPEYNSLATETTTTTTNSEAEVNLAAEAKPSVVEDFNTLTAYSPTSSQDGLQSPQKTTSRAPDELMITLDVEPNCRITCEVVLNRLFDSLDNPEVQLCIVFVACTATLATALQVPPIWLVFLVAAACILRLCFQNRQTKRYLRVTKK